MQKAGSSQPSENGGRYLGQAPGHFPRTSGPITGIGILPTCKGEKRRAKEKAVFGRQTVSESRCCEHLIQRWSHIFGKVKRAEMGHRLLARRPEADGRRERDHEENNGKAGVHRYSLQRMMLPTTRVRAATRAATTLSSLNRAMPAPMAATLTQKVAAYSASFRFLSSGTFSTSRGGSWFWNGSPSVGKWQSPPDKQKAPAGLHARCKLPKELA